MVSQSAIVLLAFAGAVQFLPKEDFRRENEEMDHFEAKSHIGLNVCFMEIRFMDQLLDSKEKKKAF